MRCIALGLFLALASLPAAAQDVTPPGYRLPPLGPVTAATPAKQLFGRALGPAPLKPESVGFYAKGCLAGAMQLPLTGPTWQVMRLSRNRMWGNPVLIKFLERLANKVPTISNWPGILVGDISQPRGGPMITGHASHQIGLDADIWLTPMPSRELDAATRETMSAQMMVRPDRLDVSSRWSVNQMAIVRAAAQDPRVERIFINAAIKKAMCRDATGDRSWLGKVRPMYGHDYHFHVRMICPPGSPSCTPQAPPKGDEGCGAELDHWLSDAVLHPKKPKTPPKPRPQMTMSQLPAQCREILAAQ